MIALVAGFEYRRLFLSPLAWTLIAGLQFILALLFLVFLENFITELQPKLAVIADAPGATDTVIAPMLIWAGILWLAVIPLLTMRSFSEERLYQRQALLMSAPLSLTEIVLGKYLGLLLFLITALLPVLLTSASLSLGTSLDWGKLGAGFLGLFLMLASFSAAGLFLSTLSRQPAMAAGLTYGLLALLFVFYVSGKAQGSESALFIYLSHFGHFLSLNSGRVHSSDVLYFLLFTAGFIILTIQRLDSERHNG
jgi:ABC-2 type transport system permease protein